MTCCLDSSCIDHSKSADATNFSIQIQTIGNDMCKPMTLILALVTVFASTQLASAQVLFRRGHSHLVPHTTTHTDIVRHGNHLHAVPHTTTHLDRVTHSTRRPVGGIVLNSRLVPQATTQYYRAPRVVPHTTTHFDRVRHGNHSHIVPHTTTHFHRIPRVVPHTTTHFDRVRHGNHSHIVPHTTTHFHRF